MKNLRRTLHSIIVIASMLFGVDIRAASPFFVQEPETIIAEVGTFVAFSARVAPPTNVVYQWKMDGSNLPAATNRTFILPAVETAHVGAYTVEAYWGATNVVSSTAFLSVYELGGTNSTFGTLTTSALQFGPQGPGFWCYYYPAIVFDRYYHATNSAGLYYYFYGPNVPVGAQTGPFINYGYNYYIRVTTAGSVNTPTHTGVRYFTSFDPPAPLECGCESGDSVLTPDLTFYSMSLDPSEKKARYRATIYYKAPAPSSGRIIMNWTYY
jgi:hypothetical protein